MENIAFEIICTKTSNLQHIVLFTKLSQYRQQENGLVQAANIDSREHHSWHAGVVVVDTDKVDKTTQPSKTIINSSWNNGHRHHLSKLGTWFQIKSSDLYLHSKSNYLNSFSSYGENFKFYIHFDPRCRYLKVYYTFRGLERKKATENASLTGRVSQEEVKDLAAADGLLSDLWRHLVTVLLQWVQ